MRTVYLLQQAGMTTGENLLQLGQTWRQSESHTRCDWTILRVWGSG